MNEDVIKCKHCGKPVPKESKFKNYCNRTCSYKVYYDRNRERILEYQKKYRKKNRQKIIDRETEYRKRNRQLLNAKQREYLERVVEITIEDGSVKLVKNSDLQKEKYKIYRVKNRDIINQKKREYIAQNKEKISEKKRRDYINYKNWLMGLPEEERELIIKIQKQKKYQYRIQNKEKIKDHYKTVTSPANIEYRKNNLGKCREKETLQRMSIPYDDAPLQMKKLLAHIRLGKRINRKDNCQAISRNQVKVVLKAIEEGRTYEAYE